MSKKIVLIDGHSILNRAFYGVPELTNAEGLHTNAIYGFLNIMFKILEEEKPDYLVVAFDRKEPTFRHDMYPEYKGTRKPMPSELREQVPVMKEILTAMGIHIMEKAGLEADDLLGSCARFAEKQGMDVALVSGDRDLLQIASKQTKIRIPKTKGGKTEVENYYEADVLDKYSVTPSQFIEWKALVGDTADNIPGVPKIGEKTATELLVTYGSIDNIYANLDSISKKSVKDTLNDNRALCELSKTLATIKTDWEPDFSFEDIAVGDFYTPQAYQMFKRLGFKNMLSRFDESMMKQSSTQSVVYKTHKRWEEVSSFIASMKIGDALGMYASEVGIAFSKGLEQCDFLVFSDEVTLDKVKDALSETSKYVELSMGNAKACLPFLNLSLENNYFDVVIAAYLLNPLKSDYDTESIAVEHLQMLFPGYHEVFGKEKAADLFKKDEDKVIRFYCEQATISYLAKPVLLSKLKETGMMQLMQEIEMPLSIVLYDMERYGIKVKKEELKEYGQALDSRITELEKSIHEKAGCDFNINSPKQLGEVLFEKMGCKGGKKTKTGYSTAADILEKMAPDYPIVSEILEYRGLTKLKSTYAEGLSNYIREDGRIHSSFNQTVTATGRISSTEPNLQNIPMRMELGRQIRKVFVPEEGFVFTDADYSQIELRILAHLSGDKQLIEAYSSNKDIHRMTASQVFHVPFDEVTDLQRRNAKAVNFGIVYGISSFGLSQDLSITKKEAASYIESYFETYPGIKTYLDSLVETAKKQGYIRTLFGRRRPIPELKSNNFMQRSFGERIAMNSPIQGTAADIMKIAMIKVYRGLKEKNLRSRLILQVHDELLIETAKEEMNVVAEILQDGMTGAADLAVELLIDMHTGENWYEAK